VRVALAVIVMMGGAAVAGCDARAAPAADGGADGANACALEPTGAFVFHVHNAGASPLLLELGCRSALPITLATPSGRLPIGPGSVDGCGFTCDEVYSGHVTPGACSDCGGGDFLSISSGASGDIPWDRRVYIRHDVDAACSTQTGTCALGFAVAPTTAQHGALTWCPVDQHPTGSCLAPMATEFTVDTTGADATIDVGP
jgi:hypothetical protein